MKNKASVVFKQVMAALSSIIKAKSMAARSKTSAAKTRLLMFSLMKKKVLMSSISHKIHSILGHDKDEDEDEDEDEEDKDKAIVLYMNEMTSEAAPSLEKQYLMEAYADEDKYPDLRHCLFDEQFGYEDDVAGRSVIDIVRSNKEGEGEDFKLEDEIDEVADLFIRRFHKQMRLQKLESFKRYQEMIQRGAA